MRLGFSRRGAETLGSELSFVAGGASLDKHY